MSRLMTIRHHAPIHKLKSCNTEATVITTSDATEVLARVAPIASGTSRNQCSRQAKVIYDSLSELLPQHRAGLCNVVTERVFLRDLARDWSDFQQVRSESYRHCGVTGRALPAVTYVGQSPCRAGQDVELLLYAVAPTVEGNARVLPLAIADQQAAAKMVQIGRSQHLYVSSLVGAGSNGTPWGTIRQQSQQMLANLLQILGNRGASPAHVLRTSVYLGEIDRDYNDFHAAHEEFLVQQNLASWPAMAIHGGRLHPPDALCGMDLHAVLNPDVARIELLQPAAAACATFGSRSSVSGVKLALPEHTYLFLSAAVLAADPEVPAHEALVPSIEQALFDVRSLLGAHGAGFNDLAQVVTRLRSVSLAQSYEPLCGSLGLMDVPHTVVQGRFCRRELLAELELTAVIASN